MGDYSPINRETTGQTYKLRAGTFGQFFLWYWPATIIFLRRAKSSANLQRRPEPKQKRPLASPSGLSFPSLTIQALRAKSVGRRQHGGSAACAFAKAHRAHDPIIKNAATMSAIAATRSVMNQLPVLRRSRCPAAQRAPRNPWPYRAARNLCSHIFCRIDRK